MHLRTSSEQGTRRHEQRNLNHKRRIPMRALLLLPLADELVVDVLRNAGLGGGILVRERSDFEVVLL